MRRRHIALLTLAAALLAPSAAAAEPLARTSATCSDYSNQADAQRAADTRDADGDGIYCEDLPCPCLKPGSGGGGSKPKPKPRKRAKGYKARLLSVTDGDTIKVRLASGSRRTVRLIGIDTPESHKPGVPVECGAREATASMLRLSFTAPKDTNGDGLEDKAGGKGRRVTLKTDATQDTKDRHGRPLAYVTTSSGSQLQLGQLNRGWAKVYVFNHKRFQRYKRYAAAQSSARTSKVGVWGSCGGDFHSEQ